MAVQEGVRRIVKVLSVAAWVTFALFIVFSVVVLFGREPEIAIPVLGVGLAVFGALQGGAWILAGFSGNPQEADGLVRWKDLSFRRRSKGRSESVSVGPVGVNGWLLLLVINLVALSPLRSVFELANAIKSTEQLYPALVSVPVWGNYKIVLWGITAILVVLLVVAGLRLRNRHEPTSVRFAMQVLWIAGPLSFVPVFLANTLMLGSTAAEFFEEGVLRELIVSVGVALIWTLYLKWSRRVRNTYFRRLYPTNTPTASNERAEPSL